ncbi:MAG: DUF2062 domain-containing protein [Granulosicoccus sp.]|nr:DUF2062 domain-containing protein [Granulosicoccus sp.]
MCERWILNRLPDQGLLRQWLHDCLGKSESSTGFRRWIRKTLAQPMLWHLNRRAVAGGVAVGLFVSWCPLPPQMLFAAVLAAVLRVHVPISMVMVWFTNPLTFAPMLIAAWRSGTMILGKPVLAEPLSLSTQSLLTNAGQAWPTLLAGSLFCASVTAVLGYSATLLIWRLHAVRRWKKRRLRKN